MFGSDLKHLKEVADHLHQVMPEWDPRVNQVGSRHARAVVMDLYPGVHLVASIRDGRWYGQSVVTVLGDGDPIGDDAQPLEAAAADSRAAARAIIRAAATSYRAMQGVPSNDASFGWMRMLADERLPRLVRRKSPHG